MRTRDATDFGNLIRGARKERGLSQQQLADMVGVSRQWISAVENGKPRAELHHAQRPPGPAAHAAPSPLDINAIVEQARRPTSASTA